MTRFLIAIVLYIMTCATATAQSFGLMSSDRGNIEITAKDGIEWNRYAQEIIISSEATIIQNDLKLVADRIVINYVENKAGKQQMTLMRANGNVVITTASEKLRGNEAVYNPNEETAVMKGKQASLNMDKGKITADMFEYFKNKNQAIARGNVTMKAEKGTVNSDTMVAYLTQKRTKNNQSGISKIEVFGNIVINNGSEVVKGDKGVYNLNNGTITLEGNVILQQGKNILKGDIADVNLNTGISRLRSHKDKRIGGTIDPKTK